MKKILLILFSLSLLSLTTVSNAKSIRIGTEGAYPPWNNLNSAGELEGAEIDFGNEACARMGVDCEWVTQDWDGIIPALLQGKYDIIIAGMSITEERKEKVNFTNGYMTDGARFAVMKGSGLEGLSVAKFTGGVNKVNLNNEINEKDNSFDAVMCVGTFTFGHVKPPALDEFIRITKNKGHICFTINEGIHEEYGFDKKIEQLNKDNKWKEIEFFKSNYIASKDVNAWLGLYEVNK